MPATDSFLGWTDGAGRNWATVQRAINSSTVEESRIVLDQAFLPTYSVSVTTAVSTAGGNIHLLQLLGSTLNRIYIRRILVTQLTGAGSTTQGVFQLRRITTAGTSLSASYTPAPFDPADPATTVAAGVLPSAQGTESTVLYTGTGTLFSTTAQAGDEYVIDWDWRQSLRTKCPVVAAGVTGGVVLKLVTAIATSTVHIAAEFEEGFYS